MSAVYFIVNGVNGVAAPMRKLCPLKEVMGKSHNKQDLVKCF